ncbi:MAG: Ig-like domain-containing protein [Propionibacteriaceae bacterium]|nr:Ig-like domain-containing protein [Propionibacteriaceae bacterium]
MRSKNIPALLTALAVAAALAAAGPAAPAGADTNIMRNPYDNTPETAPVMALDTLTTFGMPQTAADDYYYSQYQFAKIVVPTTSKLTISISAPAPSAFGGTNEMRFSFLMGDAETPAVSLYGYTDIEVTNPGTHTRTVYYKVLAGTYYLRASNNVTYAAPDNAYAQVSVSAEDVLGDAVYYEPNDTQDIAKAIPVGEEMHGTINYWGKYDNGVWTEDWFDYYVLDVAKDASWVTLDFFIVDVPNDFTIHVYPAEHPEQYNELYIPLSGTQETHRTRLFPNKGKYVFVVDGSRATETPTEYTMVFTDGPASLSTSKAAATVQKGNRIAIGHTSFPTPHSDTNRTATYLQWKSSNSKIATVDSGGIVKGIKPGKATITVGIQGTKLTATTVVTVTSPATKVKLNKAKLTLKKGKSATLKATVTPNDSTSKVKWTSSNKKVATVSSSGKVVAKKKGKATITVQAGTKKATLKLTVK